jgi:uracil phosphoribosyltransferase
MQFSALTSSTHPGEAMEHGLRECLLSVRLGHILIQHSRDADRKKIDPQVYFSHLPPHIEARPVLLMDPIVGTSEGLQCA